MTVVYDQGGVRVTRVQAARLSTKKYTYSVEANGKHAFGFFRKTDAVAHGKNLAKEVTQ